MLIILLFIILFFIILFFIIFYFYSNKNKIRSYNDKKWFGNGEYDDLIKLITFGSLVEGSDDICNGIGRAIIKLGVEKNNNITLVTNKDSSQFGDQYQLKVRYIDDKTSHPTWVNSINLEKDIDHIIFKRLNNEDINEGDLHNIVKCLSFNATGFEENNLVPENFETINDQIISKENFIVTDYKFFEINPPIEIIYQLPDDQEYREFRTNIILLNIPFKIRIDNYENIPKYSNYSDKEGFPQLLGLLESVDLSLFKLNSEIYSSLFTVILPLGFKNNTFIYIPDNELPINYYKYEDRESISFNMSDVNTNETKIKIAFISKITCI